MTENWINLKLMFKEKLQFLECVQKFPLNKKNSIFLSKQNSTFSAFSHLFLSKNNTETFYWFPSNFFQALQHFLFISPKKKVSSLLLHRLPYFHLHNKKKKIAKNKTFSENVRKKKIDTAVRACLSPEETTFFFSGEFSINKIFNLFILFQLVNMTNMEICPHSLIF